MTSRIVGTGRYVPEFEYSTEFMAGFSGYPRNWDGEKIEKLTGIYKRRFAIALNSNTGLPIDTHKDHGLVELHMAECAAHKAIAASGYEHTQIDMLVFVSCTAQRGIRRHFAASAHELHHRLKLRPDASVDEMDAGCGGAVHAIERISERLGNERRVAIVIAANMPSQYMNRDLYLQNDAWLSSLIFGDGAAAIVLDQKTNGVGLLGSFTSVQSNRKLMELRGNVSKNPDLAYHIDGREVKKAFGELLTPVLENLFTKVPEAKNADRVILHQVNKRVLTSFVEESGIDPARVPIHVDYRGNIAAAATLDILADEVEKKTVSEGSLVVIAAVGAGAQVGAVAYRL